MLNMRASRFALALLAGSGLAALLGGSAALSQSSGLQNTLPQTCTNLRFGSVPDFRWQGEGGGYNPFTPQAYTQEGHLEVRSTVGTCSFFVTFAAGSSGNFGTRTMTLGASQLPYNIHDSVTRSNVLKDLQTANENEILTGVIPVDNPGTESLDLSYYVHMTPGLIRQAGDYTDTVTMTLYRGTLTNYTQMATRNVRYRALIPKVAEASVVSSGGVFDANATQYNVDFGILQEGDRDRLDVLVRTNAGYKLELLSQNLGKLRLIGGAGGTVPYTLTVGGQVVNLSSKVTIAERSGVTQSGGDRFPMQIEIGTMADAVPGNYRDDITVIVRTTD